MIENELTQIGFSLKEARVYICLLKLGSQPASVIARKLKLSRSTAQFILESLVDNHFANKVVRKKIFFYTAEPPENLKIAFDLEKDNYLKQIDEKKKHIDEILPQFSDIIKSEVMYPKIKYYEGVDGMKKLYLEILNMNEDICSIEGNDEMSDSLGSFVDFFVGERKKRNIFNRVICPTGNKINPTSKKQLRETKYVSTKKYPLCSDMKIMDSMVAIFDFSKNTPVAISIESENLVRHFKIIFQLLWDNLGCGCEK